MLKALKTIRQLRPNIGISRVKSILEQHEHDIQESLNFLDEDAIRYGKQLYMDKLQFREANYGTVTLSGDDSQFIVHSTWSETDFVAKTDNFQQLRQELGQMLLNDIPVQDNLYKSMGYLKELIKCKTEAQEPLNGNTIQHYQHNDQELYLAITNKPIPDIITKSLYAQGFNGQVIGSDTNPISSFFKEKDISLVFSKTFNVKHGQ